MLPLALRLYPCFGGVSQITECETTFSFTKREIPTSGKFTKSLLLGICYFLKYSLLARQMGSLLLLAKINVLLACFVLRKTKQSNTKLLYKLEFCFARPFKIPDVSQYSEIAIKRSYAWQQKNTLYCVRDFFSLCNVTQGRNVCSLVKEKSGILTLSN